MSGLKEYSIDADMADLTPKAIDSMPITKELSSEKQGTNKGRELYLILKINLRSSYPALQLRALMKTKITISSSSQAVLGLGLILRRLAQ